MSVSREGGSDRVVQVKGGTGDAAERERDEMTKAGRTASGVAEPVQRMALERVTTVANYVTIVRTLAAMGLAVAATAAARIDLLVVAYLVYWIGDALDGQAARRLDQETRIGAVFDIAGDRASTILCAGAFIAMRPEVAPPVAVFLVQFAVVDTMLSLGFLYFPVKGPNDMHQVDQQLWRWNWSHPAKATNNALVILLCVIGQPWLAVVAASGVLVVKLWSLVRMRGLLTGRVTPHPRAA